MLNTNIYKKIFTSQNKLVKKFIKYQQVRSEGLNVCYVHNLLYIILVECLLKTNLKLIYLIFFVYY